MSLPFSRLTFSQVSTPASQTEAKERSVVLLLCFLAALHVFVFAAAFPFFNVVDEQLHVDLVVHYSHGDVPRALSAPDSEALPYLIGFGTLEYLYPPTALPGGHIPPPLWKQPLETAAPFLAARETQWKNHINHEASQPPLYYSLAGAWWRLGKLLGFGGAAQLYWLRFLNLPLVAGIAWLGWFTARRIFPDNKFIRLAVPALVAFLPQTIFYAVNNDILAPLTFGAVFVLLLKVWSAERLTPRLAVTTGLAFAAAYLTKTSNLPLLAVAALFLLLKVFLLARKGRMPASIFPLLMLILTAGLPMAGWMIWCKIHFGDFTGSDQKIQFLNWRPMPLAEWFHHPLFTPSGAWYFISRNLSTFWQGEFMWERQPLALPAVDLTYVALTLGVLALTLVALPLRPSPFSSIQRTAIGLGFACVLAAFTFFAWLSVRYDFQDCFYPSRARPFFVSGRLMLGMLIPFLLLIACGLDRLVRRFQAATKFTLLCALLGFMLASEITIDWAIFPNEYNWFHL